MGTLIIEFKLQDEAVDFQVDAEKNVRVSVELGNGVVMSSPLPAWVKNVEETKLQLVMEVEGSPPSNANPSETPVQ